MIQFNLYEHAKSMVEKSGDNIYLRVYGGDIKPKGINRLIY